MTDLTPWEQRGDMFFKRDDLYEFGGARGGKVRTAERLARDARAAGADALVSCGARESTQLSRIAAIGQALGMRAVLYVPSGAETTETARAEELGAELRRVKPGYMNVLRARARDAAEDEGLVLIPWGLECSEAIEETAAQVDGMPPEVARLVVPVGSGMTLAGILHGLARLPQGHQPPEILGVMVGGNPTARLDQWAPEGWRFRVVLEQADRAYAKPADNCLIHGVRLDPYYEAKTIPFLRSGDGLWVVAIRADEEYEVDVPEGDEFGEWMAGLPRRP